VPKVLRVGLSATTSHRKQAELTRVFGESVEIVSLSSPNIALIVERAESEAVDAVAIDVGQQVAVAVARQLPRLPVLRALWQEVPMRREYRNERGQVTRVTETVTEFPSYGRVDQHGEVETLGDGELG
jgi:hypothetical protein